MEAVKTESGKHGSKTKIKPRTDSLRVKRETKKRILAELVTLNKKDFGKPITPDQYVALAVSLLKADHLQTLKDQSLTARDRFEQKYQEHCAQHGKISKDDFLSSLLK